jgi:23S rRNA pseudouridine1911/1915/1917 synthase
VGDDIPAGLRLDRYVAEELKLLSRSALKTRLTGVRLNGRPVKLSRPLKAGDALELSWADPPPVHIIPEDLPLDILYEDQRVVVVNKAQGMVVHPGAGNHRGTLANALLFRRLTRTGSCGGENPESLTGEGLRPGIVHRLDKDTSGVIIAAYDDRALTFLADQFKARRVRKIYAALIPGVPRELEGLIETRIVRDSRDRKRFAVSASVGKTAITRYRVIRTWGSYSLVLLRPKTGRTHQLRLHLRYLGHSILGDPIYGSRDGRFPGATLMLHAKSLSLELPDSGELRSFSAPLPSRFRDLIGELEKK